MVATNDFTGYLKEINFEKHLKKLEKKLKGKKVVIYGTGAIFQTINENYDLKKLNILSLSDKKFFGCLEGETFLNYPVCSPEKIKELNPDYVLVATMRFVNVIDDLETTTLAKSKIKVRPLIKKPFKELWEEIWG